MRRFIFIFALWLISAQQSLWAQAWPAKPIRIITPAGAGSPPDVLARALGQRLQTKLGQPVVVENRPGANTLVAMQACAGATPDGYSFCLTTNDSVSLNPHLYSKLPYDAEKSFAPVAILAWPNSVIVATTTSGIKSLKEAVALAKAKPGTLNWGSFGNGSSSHLYLEWLRSRTGWDVAHVPYNAGTMVPAALGGQIQLTYFSIGALKPHIDAGKLVPLAVVGSQRSPFLPDVPTIAETGVGDFKVPTWFGLFAPAGTPADIVTKMNQAALETVNDAAFKAGPMAALTLTPGQGTPAQMATFMAKDREHGGELVRIANFKLD